MEKVDSINAFIDQGYMNSYLDQEIKNSCSDEMRCFFENQRHGGKCFFCEKQFVNKSYQSSLFNYRIFEPDCNCYQKIEEKKRLDESFMIKCKLSGIPDKFLKKTISDLSFEGIDESTKTAIRKVVKFLKSDFFEKKIGCLLYGDIGVGKTLLASLIFKKAIYSRAYGKWIRMADLLNDIMIAKWDFVDSLTDYDILLLDDLDKLKAAKSSKTGWASERIFSLFDDLVNKRRIIIATTNVKKLTELNTVFDASVVSRIVGACEVINIEGKDYRMREREELKKNAGLL